MNYHKRDTRIQEVLPKLRPDMGPIPRWVKASLLGAGICIATVACEPPDKSGNNTNNSNNVNNVNNNYIDCCVNDYGMTDLDIEEDVEKTESDSGPGPDAGK